MSEAHDASSWPYGREREIADWVDSKNPQALLFDVRGIVDLADTHHRLSQLRQAAGNGWPYYSQSDESHLVD